MLVLYLRIQEAEWHLLQFCIFRRDNWIGILLFFERLYVFFGQTLPNCYHFNGILDDAAPPTSTRIAGLPAQNVSFFGKCRTGVVRYTCMSLPPMML